MLIGTILLEIKQQLYQHFISFADSKVLAGSRGVDSLGDDELDERVAVRLDHVDALLEPVGHDHRALGEDERDDLAENETL